MRGDKRSVTDHRRMLSLSAPQSRSPAKPVYHLRTTDGARGEYVLREGTTVTMLNRACLQLTGKHMPDEVAEYIHTGIPNHLRYEYFRDDRARVILQCAMTQPSKKKRLMRIVGMLDRRQRDNAFKRCLTQAMNVALGWSLVDNSTPLEECALTAWADLLSFCYHGMVHVALQESFVKFYQFALQRSLALRI
jgi:hypothetical protein